MTDMRDDDERQAYLEELANDDPKEFTGDLIADLWLPLADLEAEKARVLKELDHQQVRLTMSAEAIQTMAVEIATRRVQDAGVKRLQVMRTQAAGGGKRYPTDAGMNDGEESSTKPKIDNKPKKDDRPAFQSNGKRMPHPFKPSEKQLWLKKDAELKKDGKPSYNTYWYRAALIARDLKYLEKWEVKTPISDPEIKNIWPVSYIRKHIAKNGK